VSALVTLGADYLGAVGPFPVDRPFWCEVAPVADGVREALGVPVLVLRLLSVDGGEGARGGHVTYHVEALARPADGVLVDGVLVDGGLDRRPVDLAPLTRPDPLRSAWATADGLRELLGWAAAALRELGRPPTGPVRQRRAWNLAGLCELPTSAGLVWLKATPAFAADEAAALTVFGAIDPGLVPTVLAAGEHRVLLADVPGRDGWHPDEATIRAAVHRWVAAQATLARHAAGHPDRLRAALPAALPDYRGAALADRVAALLAGPLASTAPGGLTAAESRAATALLAGFAELDACGLPDTVVHGDFHPGNWRCPPDGPPVVLDLADAYLGNPVLDGLRLCEFLPEASRPVAARTWVAAWRAERPAADPAGALALGEPLAHLGAGGATRSSWTASRSPSGFTTRVTPPPRCGRRCVVPELRRITRSAPARRVGGRAIGYGRGHD
jgi:hypothetical protein